MIDVRVNSSEASLSTTSGHTAIGFGEALSIPGVIEFSLSLFFAKLVSYTFLYWLPKYIESSSKYLHDCARLNLFFIADATFELDVIVTLKIYTNLTLNFEENYVMIFGDK